MMVAWMTEWGVGVECCGFVIHLEMSDGLDWRWRGRDPELS